MFNSTATTVGGHNVAFFRTAAGGCTITLAIVESGVCGFCSVGRLAIVTSTYSSAEGNESFVCIQLPYFELIRDEDKVIQ